MNKLKSMSPLLFTLLGLGVMSFVTYRQFQQERELGELVSLSVIVILYVSYLAYESRISIKELGQQGKDYDFLSMELAAVVKITLLITCLGVGPTLLSYPLSVGAAVVGGIVMILGFYIRSKAILDLGEAYAHKIRPIKNDVYDRGIYAVIRHGAYAGTLLIHFGVVLAFLNVYSLIMLFAWLGVVILRVVLEERLLTQDPRYRDYAQKTQYKLIPRIW